MLNPWKKPNSSSPENPQPQQTNEENQKKIKELERQLYETRRKLWEERLKKKEEDKPEEKVSPPTPEVSEPEKPSPPASVQFPAKGEARPTRQRGELESPSVVSRILGERTAGWGRLLQELRSKEEENKYLRAQLVIQEAQLKTQYQKKTLELERMQRKLEEEIIRARTPEKEWTEEKISLLETISKKDVEIDHLKTIQRQHQEELYQLSKKRDEEIEILKAKFNIQMKELEGKLLREKENLQTLLEEEKNKVRVSGMQISKEEAARKAEEQKKENELLALRMELERKISNGQKKLELEQANASSKLATQDEEIKKLNLELIRKESFYRSELEKKALEHKVEIERNERIIAELKEKLAVRDSEINQIVTRQSEKIREYQGLLGNVKKELEETREKFSQEKNALADKIEKRDEEIAEKHIQIINLTDLLEKNRSLAETRIKEKEEENQRLLVKTVELDVGLRESKRELEEWRKKEEEWKKEIESYKEQVANMAKESEIERTRLSEEIGIKEGKIRKIIEEKEFKERQLLESGLRLEETKRQKEQLQKIVDEQGKKIILLEMGSQELRSHLVKSREEAKNWQIKLLEQEKRAASEETDWKKRTKEKEVTIVSLEEKIAEKDAEINRLTFSLKEKDTASSEEKRRLENEINRLQATYQEEVARLEGRPPEIPAPVVPAPTVPLPESRDFSEELKRKEKELVDLRRERQKRELVLRREWEEKERRIQLIGRSEIRAAERKQLIQELEKVDHTIDQEQDQWEKKEKTILDEIELLKRRI